MHRDDFEIFKKNNLTYLDNAATSQIPNVVLDKINEYYINFKSNINRGQYIEAEKATGEYENARYSLAEFINADQDEIVFTYGATDASNKLVNMIEGYILNDAIASKDMHTFKNEIVICNAVHNSDLLPLQELAKRHNLKLIYGAENISEKSLIVSHMYASNVTGEIFTIKNIFSNAKRWAAFTICDATAAAGHINIDVKDLDVDALYFSGHKMCGPTGIGALYIKREIIRNMYPAVVGGGMVWQVGDQRSEYRSDIKRYEAGTPNIAGAIGLGGACEYLNSIGQSDIRKAVEGITKYAIEELGKLEAEGKIKLYAERDYNKNIGIVSFAVYTDVAGERVLVHPHDVSQVLAEEGIAVRAGHHCAPRLISSYGLEGLTRASFYFYNTREEIDKLIAGIIKVTRMFAK